MLLAGALGLFAYRSAVLPPFSGTLIVPGLVAPVEIVRDAQAIPHIYAQQPNDAYFALGYVHAQDRLWQMEFNRRLAAGRTAEILGPAALDVDRFLRTLGIRRNAQAIWLHYDLQTQQKLQAYIQGINAWIRMRTGPLPPEFLILGVAPELWQPADAIAWLSMMAWDLSANWTQEVLRMQLAQHLPLSRIQEFLAPYPGESPLQTRDYTVLYRQLSELNDQLAQVALQAPPSLVEGMGSNNWTLSGKLTQNGKPLLANDPHLGLSAPSPWYFAHLQAPGLNVMGATIPGLPMVILGRNARIAWGLTNTASDVQDLYIERIHPKDPQRYQTPDGWAVFQTRQEIIQVKGQGAVTLTVRETRHGPVISDLAGKARQAFQPFSQGYVMALRWTALTQDDMGMRAGLALNQAQNWSEFLTATRDFTAPQQNIVYADVEGNIAFIAPGKVPVRSSDNDLKGLAPALGWESRYDWQGYIPFTDLPQSLNPHAGMVVTANHKIVTDEYPYFLTSEWAPPYRAQRIHDLLATTPVQTIMSTARIQTDVQSLAAQEALPLLLGNLPTVWSATDTAQYGRITQALRAWNGDMRAERPEPLILSAWLRSLSRAMFEDKLGTAVFQRYWEQRNMHLAMVNALRLPTTLGAYWCNQLSSSVQESCQETVTSAFRTAIQELERRYGTDWQQWQWGRAHTALSAHRPFSRLPLLAPFFDIREPVSGDTYTVNATRYALDNEQTPFISTHGPSPRLIYDLATADVAWAMLPGGQSGNPLSPYYRNWSQLWAQGRYVPLSLSRQIAERNQLGTLKLQPSHLKIH